MADKRRRFIKTKSAAGVRFIKDQNDESLVCIVLKSDRPDAHTDAMLDVMLDALNNAVERKNVVKPV